MKKLHLILLLSILFLAILSPVMSYAQSVGINKDGIQSLQAQTLTYCEAGATDPRYEKISRVALGSINNSSTSTAGYENFTSLSTTLGTGSTTARTVELSNAYIVDQVIVWIDFNRDGDFTDGRNGIYVCWGQRTV